MCIPPPSLARLSMAVVSTIVFGTTFSFFIRSNRAITVRGLIERGRGGTERAGEGWVGWKCDVAW